MWIVTNKGFMSVVAKDAAGRPSGQAPSAQVSVRFRRPEDAAALFPDHEVIMTSGGDYACRVFASRSEVIGVLADEVSDMDYTNFKDSIPKDDHALDDACHRAWTVFGALQDGGPYGRSLPSKVVYPEYPKGYPAFNFGSPITRKADKKAAKKAKRAKLMPCCKACGMERDLDVDGVCEFCVDLGDEMGGF